MNMHHEKLVVAIKTQGKVLREFKDQTRIPFGSEFSIYIKNLNTVRALIKVEIDGNDIGDGTQFIVEPNSHIDLERFVKNGDLNVGNKFKFIERSNAVEEHRGIGAEDGLVRVEFQFEKVQPKYEEEVKKVIHEYHHHYSYWSRPTSIWDRPYTTWCSTSNANDDVTACRSLLRSGNIQTNGNIATAGDNMAMNCANIQPQAVSTNAINEAGITVPGSISEQKFHQGSWFPVEDEKHVIVLKLVGEVAGRTIEKPVTVKAKPKCVTCNRTNKATAKFCSGCGTSLLLV